MMKACSAASASGFPAASKNDDINRRVAVGSDAGITCCHTARMPGVAYMITRPFAPASIPGGSSSSDGVTGLLEGVGSPSNAVLHLRRSSLAGWVEHHSVWDASQGGLECADPAALRWVAERSETVIPQTQGTHAGRDGGSLARARGAGGSRTVPRVNSRFPIARFRSASEWRRWEGSYGRSGSLRQPSGAQRWEHLDWDRRSSVP